MHTRLSVTCLFASLLVGLSPNALAIPTKPGGSVTQLFRAPLNDRPGTDVAVIRVDYPPGGSTPPHEHPGFVYAYVLKGAVVSQVGDAKPETFEQGQMWVELPRQHHMISRDASSIKPASLLVFFVIAYNTLPYNFSRMLPLPLLRE